MNLKKIADIEKYGKVARGKKELIKFLEGKRLTLKQAILAKCYDCHWLLWLTVGKTVKCLNVLFTHSWLLMKQTSEPGQLRKQ